jgi:hypothetical protein
VHPPPPPKNKKNKTHNTVKRPSRGQRLMVFFFFLSNFLIIMGENITLPLSHPPEWYLIDAFTPVKVLKIICDYMTSWMHVKWHKYHEYVDAEFSTCKHCHKITQFLHVWFLKKTKGIQYILLTIIDALQHLIISFLGIRHLLVRGGWYAWHFHFIFIQLSTQCVWHCYN